jgi:penicillin G amidase
MRMALRRVLLRWLLWPLAIVSLPVILILAGAAYWLSTSLPETSGTTALAGLKGPVEIIRDKDGIPHVFAKSEEDAAFAIGFVHAQDRLWQMEEMRRVGAGRLAEVVGAGALPLDRFTRTVGLQRLAEATLANLDPALRIKLESYAAGVNAFLAHHRGAWPPEFMLLGIAPAPWRPVDSLLWGELMAVQLSGHWRNELLRARQLTRLSPAQVDQLWPPYPGDAPTTLAWDAMLYRGLPLARLADLAAAMDGRGASNSWVVSGAHSVTGKPILANDPHLGFTLPGVWYLAHVETPGLRAAGATVPGVPLIILGHNDRIAWGMTTTGGDVEDLFVERLDPQDPNRYMTPEGSVPFRTRTEIIQVRGASPVTLTVRETRHGPVLSDAVEDLAKAAERGTVMALSATWLRTDNRIATAIYRINIARDWPSFVAALTDFNAPEQNLTYADVDGNIGFYAAGWVPIRKAGDGRLPVPGWTGEYDWNGMIPFEALPYGVNAPRGRFVNANNKVTPPGYPTRLSASSPDPYPYHVTADGWDSPYRARRIEALLDGIPQGSLDAFAAVQEDSLSLAARDLLPYLTQADLAEPRAKLALERLRRWDGTMERGMPEPLIFSVWLRELNRLLLAAKLGEDFRAFWGERPALVASIMTRHPEWCAKGEAPSPDDCRALSAEALARALDWIASRYGGDPAQWRWGDAHQAQFRHRIFQRIPVIGALINAHIPADGGNYTVNRGAFDVANEREPFDDVHGAGFRAIYDLADLGRSRFMIAGGQSGNPFSRHFTDLVRRWRDFDYVRLAGTREELESAGGAALTLVPQ